MTSHGRARQPSEGGYALIAAVASIAVFAAMALAVLSATRSVVADAGAEQDQLQAGAAADAGIAMALSKLLTDNATDRWSIDGRERRMGYGDAKLVVRIEDERAKVPIGLLTEEQATRLLEAAGLEGERLLIARDSLLDWTDSDDTPRPFGAEASYYRAAAIMPANGFPASIEELRSIRGFDPSLVERIKPLAAAYSVRIDFDPRFANPEALAIMKGAEGSATAIDRARERSGQRKAIEFSDLPDLKGRPLMIISSATLPDGARSTRSIVVELTGASDRPYLVRAAD